MEIKYMFLMSCFMVSSTNTVSHGILEYSQGPLEFISATRFWVSILCTLFASKVSGTTITGDLKLNFGCRIACAKIFQFLE